MATTTGTVDVDQAVLELYGLEPEQFTSARNALVKAAKNAGVSAESAAVNALQRPTPAAWLANPLLRHRRYRAWLSAQ